MFLPELEAFIIQSEVLTSPWVSWNCTSIYSGGKAGILRADWETGGTEWTSEGSVSLVEATRLMSTSFCDRTSEFLTPSSSSFKFCTSELKFSSCTPCRAAESELETASTTLLMPSFSFCSRNASLRASQSPSIQGSTTNSKLGREVEKNKEKRNGWITVTYWTVNFQIMKRPHKLKTLFIFHF